MKEINSFVNHLLETSTPSKPAWNIEHTLQKKEPKWNYVDGCMMKAVFDLYDVTRDKKYFAFAKNYMDEYIGTDGSLKGYEVEEYNCDHINMGKMLFRLYHASTNEKEKYQRAIALQYSQLKTHPRIDAGNFWHKKIYPHQVWLDGLYMVQPFYLEYETTFNNNKNINDIFTQFKNVYDIMRDPKTGLYFHGYDESREIFWADKVSGLSPNFWTRSIGWFAMALVDTLEKMENAPERVFMQKILHELMDASWAFKDAETNLFFQVTDQGTRKGNYLETSGSCAIAYALMKGARLGLLPEFYYDRGEAVFDSVVFHKLTQPQISSKSAMHSNFVLKDVCLVAGLGGMPGHGDYKPRDGTYEYYISEPRVNNDAKGVAPFLYAYAETLHHSHHLKGEF
ncbi:MAG: glycoside hydrolase family 88 protein [Defluviitaleaceae bacterium]|nr:glycoside hydrolase family 88 protein [Defluviitaleaceae bacterium]MCL2275219.1 glycoside hydrolase family 88 protein [Defluviitaleaceae bacterium]